MVLPFAVNSGTLTLAVVLIASMPALFRPRQETSRQPSVNHGTGISAGIRWVIRHRGVWPVPLTTIALAMTDSAWFTLLVLYIHEVLALPTVWYGILLAIGAVGGLAGGFIAARVSELLGSKKVTLCCLGLAASGQLLLGTTRSVPATAAVLATSSMAFAIWNVIARTSIQQAAPAGLLGRVISVNGTMITAASILGAFLGGLAAKHLGLHAPFLLGLPVLVAAGIFVATRQSIASTQAN
jgi:predicted MFS family arabinose efflux permease